jgi:hypothetical protein
MRTFAVKGRSPKSRVKRVSDEVWGRAHESRGAGRLAAVASRLAAKSFQVVSYVFSLPLGMNSFGLAQGAAAHFRGRSISKALERLLASDITSGLRVNCPGRVVKSQLVCDFR